jgi:6-phosphogluconolactonase
VSTTPRLALVGSRTTRHRDAIGTGITAFALDATDGWRLVGTFETTNPSFLALDPRRDVLHAVHGDGDQISTFAVDTTTGRLTLLGTRSTMGTNPAHLTFTPDGRFVVVANHSSGSIVSLPVEEDGTLGTVCGSVELAGAPGPHRSDQTGPKPHQVVFDPTGRYFLAPDKGVDAVAVGAITADGALRIAGSVALREGSGPRHLVFHPHLPCAYTIDELSSTVTVLVLDVGTGSFSRQQILPTTDSRDVADTRGAEITIDASGEFLYASNRSGAGDHTPGGPGQDSIAIFRVDPITGLLDTVGFQRCGGIRPRFIALNDSGSLLFCANERSHTITELAVAGDGTLSTARVVASTGSPVCIVFR